MKIKTTRKKETNISSETSPFNDIIQEIDLFLLLDNKEHIKILLDFMGIESMDYLFQKVSLVLNRDWNGGPKSIEDIKKFDWTKVSYQIGRELNFNSQVFSKICEEDKSKFSELFPKLFRILIGRGLSPILTKDYPELIEIIRSKFGNTIDEIAYFEGLENKIDLNSMKDQFNRAFDYLPERVIEPPPKNTAQPIFEGINFKCKDFKKIKKLSEIISSNKYGFILNSSKKDFYELFTGKSKNWKQIEIMEGKLNHLVLLICKLYQEKDKHPPLISLTKGKGFLQLAQGQFIIKGGGITNTNFKTIRYKISKNEKEYIKINNQLNEIINQL